MTLFTLHPQIFLEMYSPKALKIVAPYLLEEKTFLEQVLLKMNTPTNFVGIGVGPYLHGDLISWHCEKYIAIDPLIDSYKAHTPHKIPVQSLPQTFSEAILPPSLDTINLFMFVFNVISYIDVPHQAIQSKVSPQDIVLLSSWHDGKEATKQRNDYFNCLETVCNTHFPDRDTFVTDLEAFMRSVENDFQTINLYRGSYCDILELRN